MSSHFWLLTVFSALEKSLSGGMDMATFIGILLQIQADMDTSFQ